jgi:hypothetical protein
VEDENAGVKVPALMASPDKVASAAVAVMLKLSMPMAWPFVDPPTPVKVHLK